MPSHHYAHYLFLVWRMRGRLCHEHHLLRRAFRAAPRRYYVGRKLKEPGLPCLKREDLVSPRVVLAE